MRQARKDSGFDKANAAAEAMGVKVATYNHHENGTRPFRREASRYAKFFKVSLDWLVDGRGPKPRPPAALPQQRFHLSDVEAAADSRPRGPIDLRRLARLIDAAKEQLESKPISDNEARLLVEALQEDSRVPPDPRVSAPEEDQIRVRADSVIRFALRK
ncbi:helix-turn-helix domain-containing protein [Roseiarcus fermentans]|uniref:helix-turn-helix domain-containing protein n=1 Tax=Roseiarcus fermentans TaxID=1473586 RepID=UPI0014747667|nr:helix-turn-helix transcriptional regulator [Roseiarcus fermentans]